MFKKSGDRLGRNRPPPSNQLSLKAKSIENLKVYHHVKDFGDVAHPVMTTGTFDGVHTGHRFILDRLNEMARNHGGETVLFTFDPHPRTVLFPDDDRLRLLNTQREKIERVQAAGIDHLIIHPFTEDFARMTPFDYVRDLLVNEMQVKTVVIGYDHRFGKNREGDFDSLREFGEMFGFSVEEIPPQMIDEVNVSSTKIRRALLNGDVTTANKYLAYNYPLSGRVIKGDGIGRTLEFPTANLEITDPLKLIPADGVYAVRAVVGAKTLPAMMNIGHRPTLSGKGEKRIEVHLINEKADLYGEQFTVHFVERIRDEVRFDSLDALRDQLLRDRQMALDILV